MHAQLGKSFHPQYIVARLALLVRFAIALCWFALASVGVQAAIEVVEGQPTVVTSVGDDSGVIDASASVAGPSGTTYSTGRAGRNASAELYVQLQTLQVEMSELRGLVEQQAYLIEQLSQRRMDDYRNLDRRIGELQQQMQGGVAPRQRAAAVREPVTSAPPKTLSSSQVYSTASAPPPAAAAPGVREADDAREVYSTAYQMVKDRQFSKAKVGLSAFIKDFPASEYVPSAHFWLGELYYLDSSLEKSRDSFEALVTGYSKHRKAAEAKFKLGKIYHQLGDVDQARAMLESVLNDHPNSTAVNPAREYLKNSL